MLSKNNVKLIKSLQIKKYRQKEQCFVVEGAKNVLETLHSDFRIQKLFYTQRFFELHSATIPSHIEQHMLTAEALSSISDAVSNQEALALVQLPTFSPPTDSSDLVLALDDIKDPGNLGTIIRLADWYGIKHIFASEQTVDVFNPKTIRSSMGSFLRVKLHYGSLEAFFNKYPNMQVYAAMLQGESAHLMPAKMPACLLIGSESHGVSEALLSFVHHKVTIPGYGGADSLNAAMATAILCDNFRRIAGV
jgi:RNA methyltransferase, TrmH family